MNNQNFKMNTAIFFGAGASASEGAPIQSNLFRDYFKIYREANNHTISTMEKALSDFFKVMFDIDVNHDDLEVTKFPTFEEALGTLDLADIRNESFKKFSNLNLLQIAENLNFLDCI